ncbi:IclR family transcriptional regulator [Methylocella sp. CPCC 101449]|jgi:DNA-binding IclR family transcriptional regulator|uniref:IclR family transcriptional regulator n=1 Tax=Methylocella sp. CPCC 101449 TaxID=2987531 RepID=UPI00288C775A|nr:IclR family transcriptional regulator [Methylocella sp. CPCC 101449]MDT2023266.1 IclR family transcriptional regulator [Methylocella sp. CPCC 101449]HEV2574198.1 IclR family transcriptional regulator [Beijerinckiaceae bacterium]
MTPANRVLAILQLFENGQSVWTVEEIARELGASTSTTYRHVRELVQSGFLDPVAGAGYALGPAFIRYDRILRQNDELIRIAAPIMEKLLAQTSQKAMVILCRRFKDCVMCVFEVHGSEPHLTTSYERGVAMPMFLGATSKVILANLPDRTLKAIYLSNEQTIHRLLHVEGWPQFKEQIRGIKRAGYAMTDSEVAPGRIGLAAPIARDQQVVAGISLVAVPNTTERQRLTEYRDHVIEAARLISAELSQASIVPR